MLTSYLDFDLRIERFGDGYRTRVINSPAGEAVADFERPFSALETENFNLRMINSIGALCEGVRRLESAEREAARTFGGGMFAAVFTGDVLASLRASLGEAQRRGAGLRVRLRLADVPELADLPWECLYNPGVNRFLALSPETPLVRYLDLPESTRGLGVSPPLRMIAMISSPSDYPELDVEEEWRKLDEDTAAMQEDGRIVLERLEEATLAALQRRLRTADYHVFHFIGHGGFVESAQDGALILEDDHRRARVVAGEDLGVILHGYRPLRLVMLNACEGARGSATDPFSGAAQSLVQQGIPAVIAMQFRITDRAAILFAREFYGALPLGLPVDTALTEARRGLFAAGHDVEWAVPVLYMRSPNGRLCRLASRPQPVAAPEPAGEQPSPHAPSGASSRRDASHARELDLATVSDGEPPDGTDAGPTASATMEAPLLSSERASAREVGDAPGGDETLSLRSQVGARVLTAVVIGVIGGTAWLVRRGGDAATTALPVCPRPNDTWQQIPVTAGESVSVEGVPMTMALEDAWYALRDDGWFVLVQTDVENTDAAEEHRHNGEWPFYETLVVDGLAQGDPSCFSVIAGDEVVAPGQRSIGHIGFEVSEDPTGKGDAAPARRAESVGDQLVSLTGTR